MFFADTQNKLLHAVTGHTAAEIIVNRADAEKPNMALTAWKGSIVRKGDIFTAKNYLTKDEIDTLNRLVVIFLETAELRAKNRQDLTMDFWRDNVDRILDMNDQKILSGHGTVSNADMEKIARKVYDTFDAKRKAFDARQADEQDLKELEQEIKKQKNAHNDGM
jgi:hypothetical protein